MTTYEYLNLVVSIITLVVLSLTLCFLIRYTKATITLARTSVKQLSLLSKYAKDTNTLARTSVEQLPRPYVVLKQSADSSTEAVLRGTTVSLSNENPLIFKNVGTGQAVNCQYHVRDTEETGEGDRSYRLPEIGPSDSFESPHVLNSLPENAVVKIEYESVAGSHYRIELVIEDRKFVRETRFESPLAPEEMR